MDRNKPAWLPDMLCVDGEREDVIETLHQVFINDFKLSGCKLTKIPVWWDRRKIKSGKCVTFWHIITKTDKSTGKRLFDPLRAERLPWCKPTIEHTKAIEVKAWNYREAGGNIRTYIWLEHWDYVIVLERKELNRGPVAFLITAFHVDYSSTKRNLLAKYKKRVGTF